MRAVFFDLDGTLVDSEIHTDRAISAVTEQYGIENFALPHTETRGRTWLHVAERIRALTKIDRAADSLPPLLEIGFICDGGNRFPAYGAVRAAAASNLSSASCRGSPRAVIDSFLDKLGVADSIDPRARIGGDAVSRSKPDPEGYLLAARASGVDPADALVFEDSQAGLLAARAAGMRSVFITCCASDIPGNTVATASCTDYRSLPPDFWQRLAAGGIDLSGRTFK